MHVELMMRFLEWEEKSFLLILLDCSNSKAFKIAERLRKNVENNDFYISDTILLQLLYKYDNL